jgi:hypothetical protein
MTFYRSSRQQAQRASQAPPTPIPRSTAPAFNDVEQAIEADRLWFAEHPDEDEYIREFCPGEFGKAELPHVPPGFRYVTLVTVIHRTNGVADGRYRRMIAVCDQTSHA